MSENKFSYKNLILYALGLIPVIYLSLITAPHIRDGLAGIVEGLSYSLNENPLDIKWCDDSLRTALIYIAMYILGLGIYLSNDKNYRRRKEHGSAKWGRAESLKNKYMNKKNIYDNKILTKNVKISFDTHAHQRNLNVLVVGGSGAGKTRTYAIPNLLQANVNSNCSFCILDPKSEILRSTGNFLRDNGYKILTLDLLNPERSNSYNPFNYIRDENDIQKLVTNIFENTTPKDSKSSDPFWDHAAQMLLIALMLYLHYEGDEGDKNFSTVLDLIRGGAIDDDNNMQKSNLDQVFDILESKNPDHIALKYYKAYHSGSAKTLMSIQITLLARLEKFNLPSLSAITMADELELDKLGERKTALFAIIPDNDTSFNFIIGMLYTQLFQRLFYSADYIHRGSLPYHVHFLMDEFANVSLPSSFDKLLSTMRSRGISVSIILQNLAQLKALFDKQWESIVGNCDELLYLGGNEQSTHKYISELLGKETIDVNSYSQSRGRSGSYNTNYNLTGRELLTPDEVRGIDNKYAILFIRGERPVMDLKFDMKSHPNYSLTAQGGNEEYIHSFNDYSSCKFRLVNENDNDNFISDTIDVLNDDCIVYSSYQLNLLLTQKLKEEL